MDNLKSDANKLGGMPLWAGTDDDIQQDLIQEEVSSAGLADAASSIEMFSQNDEVNQTSNTPKTSSLPNLAKPKPESQQQSTATAKPMSYSQFATLTKGGPNVMIPSQYANLVQKNISQFAQQNNLSSEQEAELTYAFYNPESAEDPSMQQMAQQLMEEMGDNSNYSTGQEMFQESVSNGYDSAFESALNQYATANNLSETDVNQLMFAHNNPDGASSLPSNLQSALNQLNSQATTVTQQQFGVPQGTQLQSGTAFNINMQTAYDQQFNNLLNNQTPPLTDQEKGALEYMHYNSDDSVPVAPNLKTLLKNLQQTASKNISRQFGLPAGYTPAPAKEVYTAMLSGAFQQELRGSLQAFLKSSKPPLSGDQVELLERALSDPDDPDIPPNIKAMAAKIMGKSITKVTNKYNMPEGASTDVISNKKLTPAPTDPTSKITGNAMGYLNDVVSSATKMVNSLPEGPEKCSLINFLSAVSTAINNLQNTLYALMADRTQLANNVSQAREQQQLDQLSTQRSQIKNAIQQMEEAQNSKGQSGAKKIFSEVMQIISPIMTVLSVVMCIMTGGAALPLALAFAAVQISDQESPWIGKLFTIIAKVVADMCPSCFPAGLVSTIQMMAQLLVIIAVVGVSILSPSVFLSMGLSFGVDMLQDSGVIQQGLTTCGASASQAAMGALIMGAILSFGCAIANMVGDFLMSMGTSINPATLVANIAKTVATTVEDALKTVMAVIKEVLEMLEEIAKVLVEEATEQMAKVEKTVNKEVDSIGEEAVKESEGVANTASSMAQKSLKVAQIAGKGTASIARTLTKTEKSDENLGMELLNEVREAAQAAKKAETSEEKVEEIVKSLAKILAVLEKILSKLKKPAGELKDFANNKFQDLQQLMQLVTTGLQMDETYIDMKKNQNLAALTLQNAQFQATIDMCESEIKRMTQLITILLGSLQDVADWIKQLGIDQNKMWQGKSQVMTQLAHSSQAA